MQSLPYWRLSGFYFFYFAFIGAMAPFWGLYLQSLHFTAIQIGILMSLFQVMRIFAPNVWGWWSDRSGRRVSIVRLAGLLCLISYLGVFLGNSFYWLFLVMATMSFFWSASMPLVEATTLSHLGNHTAGYGRIRLWGSIGFLLAVIGVGYVLDFFAVQSLLWLVLGLMLGMVLFAYQMPEAKISAPERQTQSVWEIIKTPTVAKLLIACFLMSVAHGPYYTFYSIYLVEHQYPTSMVGWLWAVGVICEISVFLFLPHLFRRFPLKFILMASFALAIVRFLLIGWGIGSMTLIVLAQMLHAATFGAYHGAAIALIHGLFKGKNQAQGQAAYTSLSFGLGGTVGGIYSGYTWDTWGPGVTFTIAAICAAAGLLLLQKLRLSPHESKT